MASHAHYDIRGFFDLQKGHTLTEEMRCYSLPYGGLGFTSHILTYYTVIMLTDGRSPFRPWKKLKNSSMDLWLSIIGLTGGFALAVFTLVKCRNHWQLLVIGIWKLSMSVFNGTMGIDSALILGKAAKKNKNRDASSSTLDRVDNEEKASQKSPESDVKRLRTSAANGWVAVYLPGMIAGFAGLVSLILQDWSHNRKLHIITYAFGGIGGLLLLAFVFALWFVENKDPLLSTLVFCVMVFSTLVALYGDWALAAMVDNLWGTPSGDSIGLYWSYLILKRLTMFSL